MFGQNLKNLRNQKNMTQDQLANILGVSRQLISKWERGAGEPSIDIMIRISVIFGVSIDDMIKSKIEP